MGSQMPIGPDSTNWLFTSRTAPAAAIMPVKRGQSPLYRWNEKYGRKPSLLATRADYVDDTGQREQLLLAAYAEAEQLRDIERVEPERPNGEPGAWNREPGTREREARAQGMLRQVWE